MADRVDLKEFVHGFILEADEHLHSVNRNLVATSDALKQGRSEPRAVRELFRSLHTIKGLASMVGVEPIVDVAHEMEGILRLADQSGGRLSEQALDLLLQGTRAIEERVRALSKSGIAGVPGAPARLIEALALAQSARPWGDGQPNVTLSLPEDVLKNLSASEREQIKMARQLDRRAVLLEFMPSPEQSARGINVTSVRQRLGELGDLVKVVPRSAPQAPTGISFALILVTSADDATLAKTLGGAPEAVQEIRTIEPGTPAATVPDFEESTDWMSSHEHSSIRVDSRRLDEALERLSEIVVTRAKLARVAAKLTASGADTRELNAVLVENTRQLKRLRAAITQARMVPLSELLQRLPLVARGLTKDSDKSVGVSIQTGSAEVDKAVADRIFPAIVHLVRNAVDHAVESREERRRSNKPETANLQVVCDESSGTSLTITVSDDGRGIDREAVARKAGRPVARTNDELLHQITLPGLSTRERVTHASGRGMGMDIVRRTVEALGGTLALSTEPGRGTTFTLRVPVSITIVDVLSFVCGEQTFVAPLATIDEIIEITASRLVRAPSRSDQGPRARLVERRGEAIPFLPLETLLGGRPAETVPPKALVVAHSRGSIALGVDRLLGQQEVVVRPLEDALVRVQGMAGATDLGDGRPTLVLDLVSLGTSLTQEAG